MAFHAYRLNEIYSNADGTVQFIELVVGAINGESSWSGQSITVTQGSVTHSFSFPRNLPSTTTANTSVLIATQGFAELGLVTPDYIVPANFLFTSGAATVNFAGVSVLSYTSLPLDGQRSLDRDLNANTNSPRNFAGASGSVEPVALNIVIGTNGADTLLGTQGMDRLDALAGDDVLDGGRGDDQLNGGAGLDTAVFHGARSAYTVAAGGATMRGSDGVDTLNGVERARFDDLTSEFLEGGAAASSVKLLSAVFGSAFIHHQAYIGIGVSYFDRGTSYEAVADLALHAKLGANPSNTELVQLLYTNVVGSAPDAATTAGFVALITSGQHTQASITVLAADHPLNLARVDLVGQAALGFDFVQEVG